MPSRQEKARFWLSENVHRARVAALTEHELLVELDPLGATAKLDLMLERIIRQVSCDNSFADRAISRLEFLVGKYSSRSQQAVAVDRIVLNLLVHLPHPSAESCARACLQSSRKYRRRGAWYYYAKHGLNDKARYAVISQYCELIECERCIQYQERGETKTIRIGPIAQSAPYVYGPLFELIANDATVLSVVGTDRALNRLPTLRLKAQVLATALANNLEINRGAPIDFRAAWIWAIGLAKRQDANAELTDLLNQHSTDADVINRVLLSSIELGDREMINRSVLAAKRLLIEH